MHTNSIYADKQSFCAKYVQRVSLLILEILNQLLLFRMVLFATRCYIVVVNKILSRAYTYERSGVTSSHQQCDLFMPTLFATFISCDKLYWRLHMMLVRNLSLDIIWNEAHE